MEKFLKVKISKRYQNLDFNIIKIITSYLKLNTVKIEIKFRGICISKSRPKYREYQVCQCGHYVSADTIIEHKEFNCVLEKRKCIDCNISYKNKSELLQHKAVCPYSIQCCMFCGMKILLWNISTHYYSNCTKCVSCTICGIYYHIDNKDLHIYYHMK